MDLAASDGAANTVERGRILEALIAYLLSCCPGVRHFNSNNLNAAGSSELDVCFWNNRRLGSLDFLPQILIVECKNTAARVGSPDVRIFLHKLITMRLDLGILVAANGITGDPNCVTAAHDVIRTAFHTSHIRLIVLTRAELEALETLDDLICLLQDKILLLTMQAQTFEV